MVENGLYWTRKTIRWPYDMIMLHKHVLEIKLDCTLAFFFQNVESQSKIINGMCHQISL